MISLEERMKLAQFLNENMDILDFLSKDNEDIKNEKIIKKVSNLEEKEDLIPSENPEETKLPELESKFNQINKILDGKNIKKEDQIKLEKLKNFYLQQKNILIENENEKAKKDIQQKYKIDANKYLKEEEERRKKAMEEVQKRIEMKKKKKI